MTSTSDISLLQISDLEVSFQTEEGLLKAVDKVSLSAQKGMTVGLVGESGCGKSVTALSVMRLIPSPPGMISGGKILWNGNDVLKIPLKKMGRIRGREIAMIFQDPMTSLNPVFTVGKQLIEVTKIVLGEAPDEGKRRIIDTLKKVGLSDPERRLQSYPHELSGGMMQRIMIAMALLARPSLLIADEPTTALDVTIQAQILALIKRIQDETGMAMLLITHDLGVVAETCDLIYVMYAGRIVEHSPSEPLYRKSLHPYTRGLLRSIPEPGAGKDTPLFTIPGTVPSLYNIPAGCRFADRCFRRKQRTNQEQSKCFDIDPPLEEKEPGRLVACHYPLLDEKEAVNG